MKKGLAVLSAVMLTAVCGCGAKEKPIDKPIEKQEEILPVPEEKPKEEKEKEYDVKLSGKLSDFQFAIDGAVHTLPSGLQEWEKNGWNYVPAKENTEIEGETYVEEEHIQKDKTTLAVDLVNLDMEKKSLEDCLVGGILLEWKKDGPVYQLPQNITMGKAVLDDVLAAYGAPTDEYEEKEEIYVTYEFGKYKEAEFVFDVDEEILNSVSLKNYREPADKSEEISQEIPKEIEEYQSPEGFSHNLADGVVSYDGQFYEIPAPVSKFTENGWKIDADSSDRSVKAGRHGYVTLEKKGQILYAVVKNYSDQTVKVENTFVTNVSGDFDVTKIPIEINRGITLGMSEENLKQQLEEGGYEIQEEEKGTAYYVYLDETKKNYIKIFVDKELRLVREIQITNSPQSLIKDGEPKEEEPEAPDNPDASVIS